MRLVDGIAIQEGNIDMSTMPISQDAETIAQTAKVIIMRLEQDNERLRAELAQKTAQVEFIGKIAAAWRAEAKRHRDAAPTESDLNDEEWLLHRESAAIFDDCAEEIEEQLTSTTST